MEKSGPFKKNYYYNSIYASIYRYAISIHIWIESTFYGLNNNYKFHNNI